MTKASRHEWFIISKYNIGSSPEDFSQVMIWKAQLQQYDWCSVSFINAKIILHILNTLRILFMKVALKDTNVIWESPTLPARSTFKSN